jgi:hypothetical protein
VSPRGGIFWGHTLRDSMKAKGLPPHLYKSGGRWRRDNAIEEIKRLDALFEYAVQHNDTAEATPLCKNRFRDIRMPISP